jgi:ribosomal protein S18 acetylase RimI-like enzyme
MQEGFLVRGYDPADWPAVELLWVATGMGGAHRGDNATVVKRTLDGGARLLVVVRQEGGEGGEGGELVGTAWLTHDLRRSYLHHFGILPAYQGRGLAHDLMAAALTAAREMGFPCKLEVHRENVRAVALYKKNGFKLLGEYDVYIARGLQDTTPGGRSGGGA